MKVLFKYYFLFFFTLFFIAINESQSDEIKQKQTIYVQEIAFAIQDEINLAQEAREGYYREFKIPEKINGKDYNISIIEELVYVKTKDEKHAIALPIPPVNGQAIPGNNIIKKMNKLIYLNL